jgi:hypothetical protein
MTVETGKTYPPSTCKYTKCLNKSRQIPVKKLLKDLLAFRVVALHLVFGSVMLQIKPTTGRLKNMSTHSVKTQLGFKIQKFKNSKW